MAKIDTHGNDMWVKDGLVFANTQQDYNEGVNPLLLQWKDNFNSFFHTQKSKYGFLIANLTLTETCEFETVDQLAVLQTEACQVLSQQEIAERRPNKIYLMRVWLTEQT